MSHLLPVVTEKQKWWKVETVDGDHFLQQSVVGMDTSSEALLEYLPTSDIDSIIDCTEIEGYGIRVSAPGYLDTSEWSVHDTEKEAKIDLAYIFERCPICLGELDDEEACHKCIASVTEEEFSTEIDHILSSMSAFDLLAQIPEAETYARECFNNEAVTAAYIEKRKKYEES